ncbi:acyltransferase family protein [Sphingomonas sp. Leaf4]|uniref:acyltransferase family protein n=1 Tax=Sphingomonas sp. Leaf4 TaxID=2876553 RepID=UPI001E56C26F|nr:acyltransferase [Sphingomonas sp. Leaf4]
MSERGRSDVIAPLQFLRGIAACGVVVEHLLARYERRDVPLSVLPDLMRQLGQTGVLTFFAISGFIMVHILLRKAAGTDRTAAGWRFARDRFTRIAPLYYLTTVLNVLFAYATLGFSTNSSFQFPAVAEWIHSLLFIPYRKADGLIQPVYGLGWTLEYEIFFYALFAIGMVLGVRRGLPFVFLTLLALAAAGSWINAPQQAFGLSVFAYFYTRPVLLYFAIGMAISLIRQNLELRLPVVSAPLSGSVALALVLVAAMKLFPGMQMIAITAALAVVTLVRPTPGAAPTFERSALALGNASYAIYLTHSFFLGALATATASLVGGRDVLIYPVTLLACAGCAIAGWLVWRFVEYPLTVRLRGRPLAAPMTVAP